jgi:hypothetical protein
MILLRDFSFIEPNGTTWIAAAAHTPATEDDLTIDGASIPPVFWSIIGGPYEGLYRNASIVHDAECTAPYKHRWKDVHRMFYRAARAGGTSEQMDLRRGLALWPTLATHGGELLTPNSGAPRRRASHDRVHHKEP